MRVLVAAFSAACLSFAAAAPAQDPASNYASKPVRILVPFAPGGAVDTTTRILTSKMTERLSWQFVVENRPGGNGFIATTAAAKAAPDGYTLLMAHTGEFAVNPALFKDVPYDLDRDFVAITMVSDGPMLYLANSQAPFNNLKELVARGEGEARLDQLVAPPATAASTISPASGWRRRRGSSCCTCRTRAARRRRQRSRRATCSSA